MPRLSERRVPAPGENVYWTAIGVVAGIGDELIVERNLHGRRDRIAVIRLQNLLDAIIGQRAVADEDAQAPRGEISFMGRIKPVDDAGNADRIVRPVP